MMISEVDPDKFEQRLQEKENKLRNQGYMIRSSSQMLLQSELLIQKQVQVQMFEDSPFIQVMVFSDCNYIDDTDEEVSTPVSKKAAKSFLKEPLSNFSKL